MNAPNFLGPGKDLNPLLILALLLGSCASSGSSYTSPPPPPQISIEPTVQYSLANVPSEVTSLDNGTLKVYLERKTGIAQPIYGMGGGPYTELRYRAAGTITLSTPDAGISFSLTHTSLSPWTTRSVHSNPLGLHVLLQNRGTRAITLDWNSVVLTDEVGRALRVIHQGVKLSDRTASMAPSVIPPGSILEDFVYPSEHVQYLSGRYGGWWGSSFFEAKQVGAEIKLYLPMKLGAEEKAYTFTFRVEPLKK